MTDGGLPPDQQAALAEAGVDLLRALNVGIWMVDSEGLTAYVNERMATLLGTSPDRIIGHPLVDHFLPDDHRTVLEHLRLRRAGTSDHYDVQIVRADGSLLPMRVQGSPVFRDGVFQGSVAALTDLSDLLAAARERDAALHSAEESNLTTSRFLSWMSHELRTPLNTIAGFAQLLEQGLDDPTQVDMARNIHAASTHVNSLVQDLLDYSKADANVLEPALSRVPLRDAIDDALRLVAGAAAARRVTIDVDVSRHLVLAHRRHLVQVLVNLLSNAVKYGGADATVYVRATLVDGRVRCSITDVGPGIPAEQQRRAFRPFERLDNAEGVPGVGLGLAIAESFTRAMNGTLAVSSPPGGGATFTLELQLAEAASGRLVLCVEDEPLSAALVESIVALLPGRTLRVETTVDAGIAAARSLDPALILLDVHLPDGTGFDVLAAVRATPSLAHVPVFILSADGSDEAAGRAAELGADRFITKPFNLKEFVALVDAVT